MTQSTDITLTFEEIIAVSHCRRDWLLELIEEDIISIGDYEIGRASCRERV